MTRYVAFLRGINVGGNHKVPMADLQKVFTSLGCTNLKLVLATGNVAFDSSLAKNSITKKIEETLAKKFGFAIPTLVYTASEIDALIVSKPFAKIKVTEDTRLYVTFLRTATKPTLKIPWSSPNKDFSILSVNDIAVCSVLTVSTAKSVDAMKVLEKEFSKDVTTRNWNTVLKIAEK